MTRAADQRPTLPVLELRTGDVWRLAAWAHYRCLCNHGPTLPRSRLRGCAKSHTKLVGPVRWQQVPSKRPRPPPVPPVQRLLRPLVEPALARLDRHERLLEELQAAMDVQFKRSGSCAIRARTDRGARAPQPNVRWLRISGFHRTGMPCAFYTSGPESDRWAVRTPVVNGSP